MPEINPYQLSLVPRTSVDDPFANIFTEQFNTSISTTARELAPGSFLPTSEVSLDLRKDLGLRDREQLQEFDKALAAKGVGIAPANMSTPMKIALAAFLIWAISKAA